MRAPDSYGLDKAARIHDADFRRFLETAYAMWLERHGPGTTAFAHTFGMRGMAQKPRMDNVDAMPSAYTFDIFAPIVAGTWTAIRPAVDVTLTGAAMVQAGANPVFSLCRPPGHPASGDLAGEYCFLNNAAIAAQNFRDKRAARVPDAVSLEDAAAIALVFITGWEAMVEHAGIGKGDMILIHGGAGGTGQMATQIARAMGARVVTTVSSAEKAALSIAAGAERTIDYRDEDFVQAVSDRTGGQGVRAVLDNIGGDGFGQSLRVLQPYGQMVTLMGTPGDLKDGTAYNTNLAIHNVMMLTPMWKGLKPHLRRQAEILRHAVQWLETGKVLVRVQAQFPLAQAAEAHRIL